MHIRWLRARRFLWRALEGISVLILLAVTPLYVRSYFVADQAGRNWVLLPSHDETSVPPLLELHHGEMYAGSNRGILTVAWLKSYDCSSFKGASPSPLHVTWTRKAVPPEKLAIHWAGFDWQYRHVQAAGPRPPWADRTALAVAAPDWFILLVAASILSVSVWRARRLRQKERQSLGLCIKCAYDLRASTERCPECGRKIDA